MSNLPYKNPISPLQVYGSSTVDRSKTFGTSFSVLNTGGFMEVYSLSDLNYTIPTGQTGNIEFTGNTIPVQFKKGSGSVFSPDVLTLNSDNISSGRRRLGMLVYVYETNKIYQHTIDNYDNLWLSASTASGPGGATVVISDFGTTVKNNTVAGQNFINSWTASTIEGVSGYTNLDATWRILKTGGSGETDTFVTGFSLNNHVISLTQNREDQYSGFNISLSAYTGNTSLSGDYLPLSGGTVTGNTIFQSGLTANTISATIYQNLPVDIYTTGFTFNTSNYDLTIKRNGGLSDLTQNLSILASDLTVTGGTYDQNTGVATFTNNTGGTFPVSGFLTGYTDTVITAFTYDNNTFTIRDSSGNTFNANFNTISGLTVNGNLSVTGETNSSSISATTITADTLTTSRLDIPLFITTARIFGATATPNTLFFSGSSGYITLDTGNINSNNTITAKNFSVGNTNNNFTGTFQGTVTSGRNYTIPNSDGILILSVNNITADTQGNVFVPLNFLPLSGGTITGATNFISGLTANTISATTISATTYNNLPNTLYTGNGNLSGNRIVGLGSSSLRFSGATRPNAIFINSSGQVGINNGSPNVALDVSGNCQVANIILNSSDNVFQVTQNNTNTSSSSYDAIFAFRNQAVTLNSYSLLTFQQGPDGTGIARIGSRMIAYGGSNVSNYQGNLVFQVRNGASIGDSMVLQYDGNLGIGTTTPTNRLHVSSNNDPVKFVGIQPSTDANILTIDTTGVVHSYPLSGITGSSSSFTGGTVNGATNFTNGLSANTISATTYQNLPSQSGTGISAFSYNESSGILTITKNDTNTLTAGTFSYVSATTLSSSNVLSVSSNGGSPTTTTINAVTGGSYSNGTITLSGTGSVNGNTITGFQTSFPYLPLSGGTVTGNTFFTSGLSVNYVDFDTTPTVPSPTGGTLYYDSNENALSYKPITPSNDVTVNLGQESLIRFYNNLGVQINNGQALHITGATSGAPTVSLAIGTGGDSVQFQISGIATHDVPDSTYGFMTVFGVVRDVNLTGFSVGEQVYLSQTVAGEFASYSDLFYTGRTCEVGHVLDNSSNGKLQVTILNEIEGTIITTQENNILAASNSSTGIFQFSGLSIDTPSGTTFSVGEVEGWIIDNVTTPANPTIKLIIYSGSSGNASLYYSSATETYILLTSASTLIQQTSFPTPQQRRQNLYLGKFGHGNKQFLINTFNEPDSSLSPVSQLRDMFTVIKLINDGVIASANGPNLNINTSAGVLYGLGIGYITNKLNPNSLTVNGQSPATFQYRTQTGGTAANTTVIEPDYRDVNGVRTLISGVKATNQRIYLLQNGQIRIQYGQQEYNQLAAAVAALQNETFVTFSNFRDNGILIGILSILSTCTDLTDTSKAQFFSVSKFGELIGAAGGTSTTTLQQAYNNSSSPAEIITNSTLGALHIQNGAGADNVSKIFDVFNSGGTSTAFMRADGLISGSSLSALAISGTTWYGLPPSTFSGGTVNGATNFTNGLTANTISATTYFNLPTYVSAVTESANVFTVTTNTGNTTLTVDAVTGGTYSNGVITLSGTGNVNGTQITGLSTGSGGSFTGGTVSGATNFTNGLTANTISATTYENVSSNFQYEIHVSQVDGSDVTGDGTLLNPVATITQALTFLTGSRKTIIVHPGTYSENVTVANGNTTIATSELTGANTLLSGTLTIGSLGSGSRISGLKMSNLVISGTAQAYISNCTVDTQVIKSSSGYVEIINTEMQCTLGIQISGSGTTIINGNKNVGISVSNASAQVIIKGCNSVVTPSASAGNLAIVDCIVTALGGNGITITNSATTLTLLNSQVLVQAGNFVAPISVAGIYSIINTIYDKPNSTFTGNSTNSVDYFQYINADKFITQGGTSLQYVMGDGSLSNGFTGGTVSGATNFTNGLTANTISATTYENVNAVTGGTYNSVTGVITLSGTGNVNGNTITGFSTGSGGLTWQFATTSITASTNNGYITTGTTSIALPTTATLGSTIEVVSTSSNLFTITQNTNQFIRFGIITTTPTSGTLISQNIGDSIRLVCTSADTVFTVVSAVGNITII